MVPIGNYKDQYIYDPNHPVPTKGGAILDEPIEHESGRITHVENEKCMPHFVNEFGCSVCIKVCPFNNVDYYKLKDNFMKKKA